MKPVSSRSDSQPNEYQIWPTLTIDRYSTQGSAHSSRQAQTGNRSATPTSNETDTAMPVHETAAKNRSE